MAPDACYVSDPVVLNKYERINLFIKLNKKSK